jgi:hypothetical protein
VFYRERITSRRLIALDHSGHYVASLRPTSKRLVPVSLLKNSTCNDAKGVELSKTPSSGTLKPPFRVFTKEDSAIIVEKC